MLRSSARRRLTLCTVATCNLVGVVERCRVGDRSSSPNPGRSCILLKGCVQRPFFVPDTVHEQWQKTLVSAAQQQRGKGHGCDCVSDRIEEAVPTLLACLSLLWKTAETVGMSLVVGAALYRMCAVVNEARRRLGSRNSILVHKSIIYIACIGVYRSPDRGGWTMVAGFD